MRTQIIVFRKGNPKYTLADVAKKLSKNTPDAKVNKLVASIEDIVATILLKEPDGGIFKEDVRIG